MLNFRSSFIEFAISQGALIFGSFRTKAGRISPYFFNSSAFADGRSLSLLSSFYAKVLEDSAVEFEMIFGSAYKGIKLAVGLSMFYAARGEVYPFSFNRKEVKDHGECGSIIGSDLKGRVLLIDDVISSGISAREGISLIRSFNADPIALVVALDRLEKGESFKASEEIYRDFGVPVISVINMDDILNFMSDRREYLEESFRIRDYRDKY